jgi:hypothetical protein
MKKHNFSKLLEQSLQLTSQIDTTQQPTLTRNPEQIEQATKRLVTKSSKAVSSDAAKNKA